MTKKVTDEDYFKLSKEVYDDNYLSVGADIDNKWVVIDKLDDLDKNGAQGVAVISKEDYVNKDYSNIVLAYRGTEPGKWDGDLSADVKQVTGGLQGDVTYQKIPGTTAQVPVLKATQFDSALDFANQVISNPKYANATFSVTGHSLGGGLASYVACNHEFSGKVYSAPNIYRLLSKEAKSKVDKGLIQKNLFNFTNEDDLVGMFGNTDSLVFTRILMERSDTKTFWRFAGLDGHFFEAYGGFSGDGSIKLKVKPDIIQNCAREISSSICGEINNSMQVILDYLKDDSEGLKKIEADFLDQVGSGAYDLLTEADVTELMEDLTQSNSGGNYYCIDKEKALEINQDLYEQRVRLHDYADFLGTAAEQYKQADYDIADIVGEVTKAFN